MLELKYIKEYSLRNKNSSTHQVVLKKLNQLRNKSNLENEIRINIFKQVTLNFPYEIEIIQKDINDDDVIIKIKIRVKLHKLFILCLITSILVGLILGNFIHSYLVLIPILLNVLFLYSFGKLRTSTYTQIMVEDWLKTESL